VFAATIVFTVHNRRDMLLNAVALAKAQTIPVEIIVMDDCSTDGVGELLGRQHPDVIHIRSDCSRGPCYQRNRGVERASAEYIFPLDDDSMLVSPRTVEQTLADFKDGVALVAIPFQNILQSEAIRHARLIAGERQVAVDFAACAHAVRKSDYLAIGGYEESFFYMGEEGDLALRLLQRQRLVELGTADPIHHLQPPARRSYRADFYGRRNDVLFYYLRAPASRLPARICGTILKGLVFGVRNSCTRATIDGLFAGLKLSMSSQLRRHPVNRAIFDMFLRLKYGEQMKPEQLREAMIQ
jgi:glycosyltransferase involved in cell wall biosynthesis